MPSMFAARAPSIRVHPRSTVTSVAIPSQSMNVAFGMTLGSLVLDGTLALRETLQCSPHCYSGLVAAQIDFLKGPSLLRLCDSPYGDKRIDILRELELG